MNLHLFHSLAAVTLARLGTRAWWNTDAWRRLGLWAFAFVCLLIVGFSQAWALTATPSTTEGPYYTLSSANQVTTPGNSLYDGHFFTTDGVDNDLTHIYGTSNQCSGTIYLLSGTLVNTSGAAISGATIEIWEADNNGVYWYNSSSSGTNNYSGRDQLFQGYGRTTTDSTGTWNFRAIKPGLYIGRIRHFHFKVDINGTTLLTSQFMFSEDSASFSGDNVAAPLVSAGTMSLVTLTSTSGTDSSGNSVLIGSKQIVVSYSGALGGTPTITTNPASVAATTGGSATFTVGATGTGTLSYQWYKGTSIANGSIISGATSSSYTISSVSSSSVGAYYALVTNTVGSTSASTTSNAAALTIGTASGSAPTITAQPTSQTVAAGSNVTFSVTATGTGTLSYQWYKSTSAISGATSRTYAISSVTASSAGSYSVKVSSSTGGSTTSNTATLTVNPSASAPTITAQPTSLSVLAGNSASFTVAASSSTAMTYQWYKGSVGSGTALSGATSATCAISPAASSDAGTYYAVVTNSTGSTASNAVTLAVTEPYTSFLSTYNLNATTGAMDADPDGDGIPNGLEFLLGSSPILANDTALPTSGYQIVNGSTALVFVFNLAPPVGGTTWAVEYSTDMTAWTVATPGVNGVTMSMSSTASTTSAGRTVYPVTVVIPTTATQILARLRVTPAQ